jgi:DNA repair protein RecO (recombination protein O)
MPLRETEALVLRTYRLGEADKIASLLTRNMGRLRAVAAGSQRPKSRFGGTLEPLSYIRLWLFERENRDLLRVNSAELLESFFDMQKDYRLQVAARYVAEVSERVLPEREVNERSFRLILVVLRGMKRTGEINRPLLYFDFWLMLLAGFLPDLDICHVCGHALGGDPGYYGPGSEGLVCSACRTGAANKPVPASALAFLKTARQSSLDEWLRVKGEPQGCVEARLFFEELIESHIEKKLVTKPLLAQAV